MKNHGASAAVEYIECGCCPFQLRIMPTMPKRNTVQDRMGYELPYNISGSADAVLQNNESVFGICLRCLRAKAVAHLSSEWQKRLSGEAGCVSANRMDYGARFYDSEIGRWSTIDPLSSVTMYNRLRAQEQFGSTGQVSQAKAEGDLTLPGDGFTLGARHPLSLVRKEIVEIFKKLGFIVAEGPEIEDDWHNFLLHELPARTSGKDMQDTFFIKKTRWLMILPSYGDTSSVQILSRPCDHFRTGTIRRRVQKVRFRPVLIFHSTEPSAEMDNSCTICKGAGCQGGCNVCQCECATIDQSVKQIPKLFAAGGADVINGIGVAGVIVYNTGNNTFIAYDRCSTVNPEQRNKVVLDENPNVVKDPAIPGDVVDVEGSRKRKISLSEVATLKKASEYRIDPFCEHFGVCGGCKWQHMDYNGQLKFKQQTVDNVLARIAFLIPRPWSQVSGLVMEKGTGTRLSDVNVTNLRTRRVGITNNFGVFNIDASIGDSLYFSKIGYGSVKTILYSKDDILIDMQAGIKLGTVIVERMTKEAEMNNIMRDYEKKGIYNGGKNKTMTYLASPATALYIFLAVKQKMQNVFRYMDREIEEAKVDRVFTRSTVTNMTGTQGRGSGIFIV
ncbi:hypothetical protein FQR65_LT16024 [Abscondita terminalis]|nr:hypothetical protein FQR65_LT16024 [Abscondita terminalis]